MQSLYILDQAELGIAERERNIDSSNHTDFWYFPKDKKPVKLEGEEKLLAQRLAKCKERRGIASGREALEACRQEVGLGAAPQVARP